MLSRKHIITSLLKDIERHWFTLTPFFLGCGIGFYFGLVYEPSPYMAPIAACFMLFLGTVLAFQTRLPDVLVSDDASAIGYNHHGTLHVTKGRKGEFVKENWLRLYGLEGKERVFIDDIFNCDQSACRYVDDRTNQRISYAHDLKALSEECLWADILIANFPIRDKSCATKIIIDRFDVWREGVHALYLTKDSTEVRTVVQERGERPWVNVSRR